MTRDNPVIGFWCDDDGVLMLKLADDTVHYPTVAEIDTMINSLQTADRMKRVDDHLARQLSQALAEIARLRRQHEQT